mmetsp:Transcript_74450/g.206769  ORF Transcript_74450/g.206769 Transcript_74450/m.206769 type:complete len:269 (-) Transcript_74450:108-914(-)
MSSEAGGAEEAPNLNEAADVVAYLQQYGYSASNNYTWRAKPPELSIEVRGHFVSDGHTHYQIHCKLEPPTWSTSPKSEGPLTWQTALRLMQMRSGLHDPVVKALGSSYKTYFCKVPFAKHLRPTGTTARLDAWCARLAYCINTKLLPPWVAAATLRLVCAPCAASVPSGGVFSEGVPTPAAAPPQREERAADDLAQKCDPDASRSDGNTETPSETTAPSSGTTEEAGAELAPSEPDVAPLSAREASDASSDFEGCPIADSDSDDAQTI